MRGKVRGNGWKVLSLGVLAVLSACAREAVSDGTTREPERQGGEAIVSNRPQTDPYFSAIIRLSRPALLASAKRVDGVMVVDPAAKRALLEEQERFLREVAAMPGEVRVLYKYRLVLNAVAVLAPIELKERFAAMSGVLSIEGHDVFDRPSPEVTARASRAALLGGLNDVNSVKFIGGARARAELKLTGRGVRVGIIDSGIDYTHAMFGGPGLPEAYASNDPTVIEPLTFPTPRVVGGVDLVGSAYNAGSYALAERVPAPDGDPLDEGGHGTHVAGTIGGLGDGVHTYDGVAPEAALYAIKVFGRSGSTGGAPVLAAFEYAADPDGDLELSDKLDVLNLSLGSSFGTRHVIYAEAIRNLAAAGTLTVCSAGNAGPVPFIVGSPSTADEALSVAASIDDSPWNWRYEAVLFSTPRTPSQLARIYDATFTRPSVEAEGVGGALHYLGTAATDLDEAQKAALAGKVALIDRGEVPFFDKVRRAAEGGATGVVVANNQPGTPFTMSGGDGTTSFDIPAIMISQELGTSLREALAAGEAATVSFGPGRFLELPERIDALSSFSSRGPRSHDALIKPEVAAPGDLIVSAAMGSGVEGVQFSGTSMAAPHVAGAAALLRQARRDATAGELKSRLMTTSTEARDLATNAHAPVAAQGAGRLRIYEAAVSAVVASSPSFSLGIVNASAPVTLTRTLELTNTGDSPISATLSFSTAAGLTITGPTSLSLAPGRARAVTLSFRVDLAETSSALSELDGFVQVTSSSGTLRIPVLAQAKRGAGIELASFSREDSGLWNIALANRGPLSGEALPFNYLGSAPASQGDGKLGPCKLGSVGYRVVTQQVDGVDRTFLQFGVRLASALTTWNSCELSVLIDADGDGVPEQELAGAGERGLWPAAPPADPFGSFLVDAAAMRALQKQRENPDPDGGVVPPDSAAVLDVQPFLRYPASRLGVVSADLSRLMRTPNGLLRVKVGVLPYFFGGVRDDFLGSGGAGEWMLLEPDKLPFRDMPQALSLAPEGSARLSVKSFVEGASLVLFLPQNDPSIGTAVLLPAVGSPRYAP